VPDLDPAVAKAFHAAIALVAVAAVLWLCGCWFNVFLPTRGAGPEDADSPPAMRPAPDEPQGRRAQRVGRLPGSVADPCGRLATPEPHVPTLPMPSWEPRESPEEMARRISAAYPYPYRTDKLEIDGTIRKPLRIGRKGQARARRQPPAGQSALFPPERLRRKAPAPGALNARPAQGRAHEPVGQQSERPVNTSRPVRQHMSCRRTVRRGGPSGKRHPEITGVQLQLDLLGPQTARQERQKARQRPEESGPGRERIIFDRLLVTERNRTEVRQAMGAAAAAELVGPGVLVSFYQWSEGRRNARALIFHNEKLICLSMDDWVRWSSSSSPGWA